MKAFEDSDDETNPVQEPSQSEITEKNPLTYNQEPLEDLLPPTQVNNLIISDNIESENFDTFVSQPKYSEDLFNTEACKF